MISWLRRAALRLSRKAYEFSTSSYDSEALAAEWHKRNGFNRLASQYGYGYTPDRALQLSALFGGVKIIGEDLGSLPLFVYRRKSEDVWEKDTEHPLYTILHDAPNPETSAIEFRESMTAQAVLCGQSYARITRDSDGTVVALWQVKPGDIRSEKNRYNATVYYVRKSDGSEEPVSREDMFVLRGFGIDGEHGADILQFARQTIGLALDQNEYASRFFSQTQQPPFYVTFPTGIGGPEGVANFKEAWRKHHQGPDKWFVPAVLQEGGTIHELRPDNEKAQLIEQRRFQIGEICRLIRLTPHKLADLDRATFSNIEHLNIQHYTETLRPYAVRWEQAIKLRLISLEERRVLKAEHAIEGFLRGDFKTQTEGFARLLDKGVWSINEVRRFVGMNPIEGGDEHYIQLNMQSVGDAAAEEPVSVPTPDGKMVTIPIRRLKEFVPARKTA